jgi:GPH family glycoside/pentoside/hexuronide:cation symporter
MAFGLMVNLVMNWFLYFYELVVLLPIGLILVANTIFTIWDALNDIIAGVITDRPYKKLIKYGQRFPWIIISSIPFAFFSIVLFTPPSVASVGKWVVFFYFLAILLIYDTLLSFWMVSYNAIRSDKYRSPKDRTTMGAWGTVFITVGGIGGSVLANLLINPADASTFVSTVAIFSVIGLGFSLLSIPGVRDSKEMVARAHRVLNSEHQDDYKKGFLTFFRIMKDGLKDSNFLAMVLLAMGNSVIGASFVPSLSYYSEFVLGIEKEMVAIAVFNISIPYTITGLITIPIVAVIANRTDYQKLFKISIVAVPLTILLFYFADTIELAKIVGGILGVTMSMFGVLLAPVAADLNDEGSLKETKRIDGVYGAIIVFFQQLGQWIFVLSLWFTHDVITDFDPEALVQSQSAQQGILAHFALIPGILALLGAIFFLVNWKITKEKAKEIREQLHELEI